MSKKEIKNKSSENIEKVNSKEICEELKTILEKAKSELFTGLEKDDGETIYQKSKRVSFPEKASLLKHFLTYPGTHLYDPGGLFETIIKVDDQHSRASKNRPLAYIESTDGFASCVEVIDILESVRNDATLIGHPAILSAIHHWQEILKWEKYLKDNDINSKDEIQKMANYLVGGKYVESARRNLEAIGKALLEGGRRQAVPKESTLALKIEKLNLEKRDTFLSAAWDRLASKHTDETQELEERINQIENYLNQLPLSSNLKDLDEYPKELQQYGYVDPTISISTVINFLKADGKRFVYNETTYQSRRPQWRVFKRAFIKWHFKKKGTTVEKYLTIAKQQADDENPYRPSVFGLPRGHKTYTLLHYVLNSPLKKYCEPIECSSETANSHEFFELINQSNIK